MLTLPMLKKCIQFQMKQLRHTKARNDTGDHGGTFEMKHQLNIMTPSITNSGHLRRTSASSTMASNWQCRQSFILKNTRTWLARLERAKIQPHHSNPFQGGINVTGCKDKQLYGLCDCVPYISHPHTTSWCPDCNLNSCNPLRNHHEDTTPPICAVCVQQTTWAKTKTLGLVTKIRPNLNLVCIAVMKLRWATSKQKTGIDLYTSPCENIRRTQNHKGFCILTNVAKEPDTKVAFKQQWMPSMQNPGIGSVSQTMVKRYQKNWTHQQ